ncbi:putative zinc-binding protein [Natronococcus occultus]
MDGCPLECTRQCLARHDVEPDRHYVLAEESSKGVPRRRRGR